MQIWPVDYDGAWTLAGAITRSGVGLHSGVDVSVTLLPSEARVLGVVGRRFQW